MGRAVGDIQDILTDKSSDEVFVEGAINFEEWDVIDNDDITILEDVEALWQGIVGCLHTPIGKIDGVGLEGYGSHLLELRGMNVNWHIAELAKQYIKQTIPQYQGYVLDFPVIKIDTPTPTPQQRFTMKIYLEVNSVYGKFARVLYI
jgi:hypothetical protein